MRFLLLKNICCFLTIALFASGCKNRIPDEMVHEISKLPDKIDYNFHVKPILSDKCFACHGPDAGNRKANLRLDFNQKLLGDNVQQVLTLEDVKSEIPNRLLSQDPKIHMPPPKSHLSLSDREIAIILKWMNQGAAYKPHWSLIPLSKGQLSKISGDSFLENEIDFFTKKKWNEHNISPSKKATKETLIRRLSFTLTGLPPSLDEIDAFLVDESSEAYEKLIDRLLLSPHYGERMAAEWMDVARYADSDGYLDDKHRNFSPWRDWVINAFNQNLNYKNFVTHQLAGDLIPNADQSSKIATAFNRLHKKNSEAGIIFEEYRTEYVADRTVTFGKAFLGMTMECARCHDHKYDPISQKNFYEISSFFNSTNEIGHAGYGPGQVAGPSMLLTNKEQQTLIDYIKNDLNFQKEKIAQNLTQKEQVFENWFANKKEATQYLVKNLNSGLVAHYPFDEFIPKAKSKVFFSPSRILGQKAAILSEPLINKGQHGEGFFMEEYTNIKLPEKIGWFDQTDPFTLSFSIYADHKDQEAIVFGHCEQIRLGLKGYSFFINDNKLKFVMARSWPQNAIEIETLQPVASKKWSQVTITYDGKGAVGGIHLYLDGKKIALKRKGDELYKSILFEPDIHTYGFEGFKMGSSHKLKTFEKGGFDELKIYDRELTALEVAYQNDPSVFEQLSVADSFKEKRLFEDYFFKNIEPTGRALNLEYLNLRKKLTKVIDPIPELMIMGDSKSQRPTYVLNRGVYDDRGEEVFPNTPEVILEFDEELPKNRLGLSQWLFDFKNPLTARVFVNRIWQMHFGKGLATSTDNLGNQGRLPTHPQLLDWLSNYFMENNWDIKKLHKKILSSATFQQESKIREDLINVDPENLLLARGPSYRMSAEMVRDNALKISGLLVPKIGGKSVYPYQPDDLWNLSDKKWRYRYQHDRGEGLYRRSLYTFWKRSAPPPSMVIFDTPNRDLCSVKRTLTSSPLQALLLLNDPQYVEAARVMAENSILSKVENMDKKLSAIFRKITGRAINDRELETLQRFYIEEKEKFSKNPKKAVAYLKTGEKPINRKTGVINTAALATVISGLMNTAEAISIN
tara:strand:+ start:2321 stop:5560 length:3240 start_codon:yes stop_codon:yes gene_type:complete